MQRRSPTEIPALEGEKNAHRKLFVLDLDYLSRVTSRGFGLRHHHRNRIANVADGIVRKQSPGRRYQGGSISIAHGCIARQWSDTCRFEIGTGEDSADSGGGKRVPRVD